MLQRLFDPDGRITRLEFWGCVYVGFFPAAAIYVLHLFLFNDALSVYMNNEDFWSKVYISSLMIWVVLFFVFFVIAGTKRLQDMNKDGRRLVVLSQAALLGVVGGFAYAVLRISDGTISYYLDQAGAIIFYPFFGVVICVSVTLIIMILWLGFTPGTSGENKYGPDPREAAL